jgi:hypothetical protein
MLKTYSSSSKSSSAHKKNQFRKVPSAQTLQHIMAYAKALEVQKTACGKTLFLLGN